MLNAKASHAIAVCLAVAGSILHFLQANPEIETEVHMTGNGMIVLGFILALMSETMFGTSTPPAVGPLAAPPAPSPAAAAAKVAAFLLLLLGVGRILVACTPSQGATATTVVNAVFSADQAACMAANEGLVGDSNAVQEFEALCNLAGPFDQAITTFIGDITKNPTAMARIAAERKAAGK